MARRAVGGGAIAIVVALANAAGIASCGDDDNGLTVPPRATEPLLDASTPPAPDGAGPADAADAATDAATDADLPRGAIAIATGAGPHPDPAIGYGDHSCAIAGPDRAVYCWGANDHGQAGTGVPNAAIDDAGLDAALDADAAIDDAGILADLLRATRLATDEQGLPFAGADTIALAPWHSCARHANDLYCWGQRFSGAQAEPPFSQNPDRDKPRLIGELPIASVATGGPHTCVVRANGKVACFGHSTFGELGRSATSDAPCAAPIFYDYPALPAGSPHTCAGEIIETATTITAVQALAIGETHSCIMQDGTVRCWGNNGSGQLGNPLASATTPNPSPVQVVTDLAGATPLAVVTQLASGSGEHTCAIVSGAVYCWGTNASGELGVDPTITGQRAFAAPVAGLPAIAKIGVGDGVSCALTTGGDLYCWGADDAGQLGDGAPKPYSFTPVQVKGPGNVGTLTNVIAVAPGRRHVCALMDNHTVFCWGKNDRGQLGDGSGQDSLYPIKVSGLPE